MACAKGDQPFEGAWNVILDKVEAVILPNTKKWNRKWIV